jgi:hypothetical protein
MAPRQSSMGSRRAETIPRGFEREPLNGKCGRCRRTTRRVCTVQLAPGPGCTCHGSIESRACPGSYRHILCSPSPTSPTSSVSSLRSLHQLSLIIPSTDRSLSQWHSSDFASGPLLHVVPSFCAWSASLTSSISCVMTGAQAGLAFHGRERCYFLSCRQGAGCECQVYVLQLCILCVPFLHSPSVHSHFRLRVNSLVLLPFPLIHVCLFNAQLC